MLSIHMINTHLFLRDTYTTNKETKALRLSETANGDFNEQCVSLNISLFSVVLCLSVRLFYLLGISVSCVRHDI